MPEKFTVVTRGKRNNVANSADYEELLERQNRVIKAVEKLTVIITRSFSDKMIEAIRNDHKYCVLYTYNDNPENGEVFNDTIDDISTRYILSGEWIPQAKKFFVPIKCRSVADRIQDYISE